MKDAGGHGSAPRFSGRYLWAQLQHANYLLDQKAKGRVLTPEETQRVRAVAASARLHSVLDRSNLPAHQSGIAAIFGKRLPGN
jgi:hypothetical protein